MNTAIVGINWGDEGKGRMVDLLSSDYDVVVRYQGGNNAGHTVINEKGKFILNLLPSGILRDDVTCVMGSGMVIDLKHLSGEVARLKEGGINVTPRNLVISDRAVICMPYDVMQDCLEEDRLQGKKFGSTRRGIGPVYSDKYMKKAVHMGDLIYSTTLEQKVRDLVEWKNLLFKSYGVEINVDEMIDYLKTYGKEFVPYVRDTNAFLKQAQKEKKNIMFEAQLGALKDIDFGITPYTSSSNVISAYAPIGSGCPSLKLDSVIGIVKAYSSAVGEGPFVCEMFGDEAEFLRQAGGEYGATTGRPRRVGGFDFPATRYGIEMQAATEIAITKIDVLSKLDKIPVCVAYEFEGKRLDDFPYPDLLDDCKPIVEYLDGWNTDISSCKSFDELPLNVKNYLKFLQKGLNAPITLVSVGADREQYFYIKKGELN